jgi:GT2 family glycosyltransferase
MVRAEFSAVQVIENSENLGFAKANNRAIRQASGDYVLLLNSDTIVRPGAIRIMAEFMDSNPQAGAVACRLLNANGTIQASIGRQAGPGLIRQIFRLCGISRAIRGERTRRFLRRYLAFAIGSTLRSYLEPYVTDTALEVESISGACLMLRRQAIDQVGFLDENFFMYLEDLDYCIRLRRAGWKLYYVPAGEIVHLVGQSSGRRMRDYSIHAYQSLFYFYEKHYSTRTLSAMRLAVFSVMCVRWVWNFVSGVFSRSPVYGANRLDLEKLIRLSLRWRTVQRRIPAQETLPADCISESRK